jgi:hypothetical protein
MRSPLGSKPSRILVSIEAFIELPSDVVLSTKSP